MVSCVGKIFLQLFGLIHTLGPIEGLDQVLRLARVGVRGSKMPNSNFKSCIELNGWVFFTVKSVSASDYMWVEEGYEAYE